MTPTGWTPAPFDALISLRLGGEGDHLRALRAISLDDLPIQAGNVIPRCTRYATALAPGPGHKALPEGVSVSSSICCRRAARAGGTSTGDTVALQVIREGDS